jgi:hypothetical protein
MLSTPFCRERDTGASSTFRMSSEKTMTANIQGNSKESTITRGQVFGAKCAMNVTGSTYFGVGNAVFKSAKTVAGTESSHILCSPISIYIRAMSKIIELVLVFNSTPMPAMGRLVFT